MVIYNLPERRAKPSEGGPVVLVSKIIHGKIKGKNNKNKKGRFI
jgi:hypothetical protein